eukprot:10985589-Alexandrium_andersonii.AAC.1
MPKLATPPCPARSEDHCPWPPRGCSSSHVTPSELRTDSKHTTRETIMFAPAMHARSASPR